MRTISRAAAGPPSRGPRARSKVNATESSCLSARSGLPGDWFTSRNLLIVARRDVLVSDFAAGELARRTGKIIKQSKKLEVPDTRGRHKLRIAIKKVRYACEFFESVYEGRKVERRRKVFTTTLKGIQSGLSRLNDMQVHCRLRTDLLTPGAEFRTRQKRHSPLDC